MKKTYIKVVIREIKQSFGRFAAIFAIVLLGVGFLFGLISTTPNMENSIDNYYDKNNMMDINIKSTLGFSQDDIDIIKSQEEIGNIMKAYSMDVLVEMGGEVLAGRILGLPLDEKLDINSLTLLEGRLPQASNEVVIERSNLSLVDGKIGDTIDISEENQDLDDIFAIREFEIVGIVANPAYFQKQAEMTHVGNGRLGAIIYGGYQIFEMDLFTDIFMTVKGAKDLDTFSDDYHAFTMDPLVEKLEELGKERAEIRYEEIIGDARDEIEESRLEAEEEIEESRLEAEEEIEKNRLEAEEEIEKGRREAVEEIEKGRKEAIGKIEETRKEAEGQIERERRQGQVKIDSARAQGKSEIERNRLEAEEEIEAGRLAAEEGLLSRIEEEIGEMELPQAQIDAMIEEAQGEIDENIQAAYEELDGEIQGAYDQLDAEIETAQAELNEGIFQAESDLDIGIEEAYILLDNEIQEAYSQLDSEISKAQQELDNEIQNAYAELDEEIEKGYIELNEEIEDAEKEIRDIDQGEWFVLDRNANTSYVTFELNSDKINAVATVFPVFFYLVAALVSLTTMTRMVEEDRMQIGTLKALGYSKITIISKYIIYSGLASLLGGLAGIIIGMKLLPVVIWNAFDSLFHLPEFVTVFNTKIALISSGIAIIGTVLVTIYVCNDILGGNAASLMQAKAPKPGKRILLERVTFIWSSLSFNQKSTIRNIFRYKKHFFMTVIGISGCMALLLTGFGLRDSIGDLADIQFNEIILYNMEVTFEDDTEEIYHVLDRDEILDTLELHADNGEIHYLSHSEDLRIIAVDNLEDLDEFINIRDRESGKKLDIYNDSAIITEKIAEFYEIQVPESIGVKNFDEDSGSVEITHISENYVGNSIYISRDKYEDVFNRVADNNTIYVEIAHEASDDTKDEIINDLLSLDNVLTANLIADNRDTFDNLLNNINYIVVVIIIASGGLAFIVLYNLTNININERKKELATFRVLGFYNEEVIAYIFRETAILTLIGILVGLGLGTILHQFVIITVEDPDFMFGRDIKLLSYMISALITIVFAFIVNIFMSKKIRDIEMADSMKAND